MLLAVDIGNTNMVFGCFDNEKIVAEWRLSTHAKQTADELALMLDGMLRLKSITATSLNAAMVASVVPSLDAALAEALHHITGQKPRFVGKDDLRTDLPIMIDKPEELGADRIVNAIAAKQLFGHNLVVIDLGTATTFDVVDHHGRYLGGVIAPGPGVSLQALHQAAAKLPAVGFGKPAQVIGRTTAEAMRSGAYYGYAHMISGVTKQLQEQLEAGSTVVATGGLATQLLRDLPVVHHHVPDLTLQGIYTLHRMNI